MKRPHIPPISTFIDTLERYDFLEKFNDVEVYIWSNFPINPTRDIDLMFIGEPTEDLGKRIQEFQSFASKQKCLKIDEQVFKDTRVFRHIEEYNRLGDIEFDSIVKYKMREINSPRIYKTPPVKINDYFWKFELVGINEKYKSRVGKLNLHYPILIQDFMQLVFNIQNPEIYNTSKDANMDRMWDIKEEFRDHIRGLRTA
tara:strand:- start:85 stop:684 length:600 start_codon:yes stop_codon:yes gene_type:complete